jgi:hypothetical protein
MSDVGPERYRERLHPPLWLWGLAALMAGSLGLAYAAPFTPFTGLVVGAAAMAVLGTLLARSAAVITVADGWLQAGPARIAVDLLGAPHPLDADAATRRRGRDADPAAWMLLRGWIPTALEVPVIDPEDDTPYWYLSTRHPDALARALESSRTGRSATDR